MAAVIPILEVKKKKKPRGSERGNNMFIDTQQWQS